jgi:DNA phosphorothioation-dependent restriction protein DptH
MKILKETFLEYIKKLVNDNKMQYDNSVQIKIPSMALTFSDAVELLKDLENTYLYDDRVNIILKISSELELEWQHEDKSINELNESWLLYNKSLTYYRNEIAQECTEKQQVLILLGADLVYDSGSLEHLLNCGFEELFRNYLNGSFEIWANKIISNYIPNISLLPSYEKEITDVNKVLLALRKNFDLLHLGQYIDQLSLLSYDDSNYSSIGDFILSNMYMSSLNSCSLKIKIDKNLDKNLKTSLKLVNDLFTGVVSLNDSTQKRYNDKIIKLMNPLDPKSITTKEEIEGDKQRYYPKFDNCDSFFSALLDLVRGKDINEITNEKLRHSDFYSINKKILKYRLPKSIVGHPKISIKKVEGTPFEMIMQALWDALSNYVLYKKYSFDKIDSLDIIGFEVKHNFSANDLKAIQLNSRIPLIYDRLIIPALGGLDEYVLNNISSLLGKVNFTCNLSTIPADDGHCPYKESYSATAIPSITFNIIINDEKYSYKWNIDNNNDISISYDIASKIKKGLLADDYEYYLPIFPLKKYANCFFMQNVYDFKDEFASALKTIDHNFTKSLIQKDDFDREDLYKYKKLCSIFREFINVFVEGGIYSLLSSNISDSFVDEYCNLLDTVNRDTNRLNDETDILLKAFWIVNYSDFINNKSIESGILTFLHPSMVEEVSSKNKFLLSNFEELLENYIYDDRRKTLDYKKASSKWKYYVELATMKSPIPCFVNTTNVTLNTQKTGEGLFYRIGKLSNRKMDAVVATKMQKSYDNSISEFVLQNNTQESKLIAKQLENFVLLYNYAREGLNLTVVLNNPIQPVLAGIVSFVTKFFKDLKNNNPSSLSFYNENPYQISLQIISSEANEFGFVPWLSAIKEYWTSKSLSETSSSLAFKYSNLQVKYNILSKENPDLYLKDLQKTIDSDFIILYGDSKFEAVDLYELDMLPKHYGIQFPILQKYAPKKRRFPKNRYNVFLNSQFNTSKNYLNLIHSNRVNTPINTMNTQTYLIENLDYSEWLNVLKVCHNNAELVLCIGKDIDTDIIDQNLVEPVLIGFGSGIGSRAELNYTISTLFSDKNKLNCRLANSFRQLFPTISDENSTKIITGFMEQKKGISDFSIFRALRSYDTNKYDFFAYILSRKILKSQLNNNLVCDTIISLDSYLHWFELEENKGHADLVWITAKSIISTIAGKETKVFKIKMFVVECKTRKNVVQQSKEKAYLQVHETLDVLKSHFIPTSLNADESDSSSTDSKYWWMQIYRIIVANQKPTRNLEYPIELENLSSGFFELEWDSSIFAFECNDINAEKIMIPLDNGKGITPLYQFSPKYIERVSLIDDEKILPWDNAIHEFIETEFDEDAFKYSEDPPKEDLPKEDLPKEDLPKEDLPKEDPPKEDPPKEDPPKEDPPEEDPLKDLRILLGIDAYNNNIYWDFGINHKMNNRHMFVFGASGSGKTYAITGFLAELAKNHQGSLVFDYNNAFTPSQIEEKVMKYFKDHLLIKNKQLNINPFMKYGSYYDENNKTPETYLEDDANDVATRVANIIRKKFTSIGPNQISKLIEMIKNGIENLGDDYSLQFLSENLEQNDESEKNIDQLYLKLQPLLKANPFRSDFQSYNWDSVFIKIQGECADDLFKLINVYQLKFIDPSVQKIIIEFCLWDLWFYVNNNNCTTDDPKVIFLDEVQNLDGSTDSPINKYLKEGRKFGISLIAATQDFSSLQKELISPLMQSSTKLFFQPAGNEIAAVAKILVQFDCEKNSLEYWKNELGKLNRGECFLLSDSQKKQKPLKIKIPSMEQREL